MISSFGYSLKQGLKNIGRNMLFSLASIATIAACIFLFCLFYAIVGNVRHSAEAAETTVGITVFLTKDWKKPVFWLSDRKFSPEKK